MSIWGRVIGGAAGFALGGPIGAILGVMAGGAFDRRSKSRSSFNFMDLNNDNQISLLEINQSISLIFQIVDFNQDGFISESEISELKNIIDSLK